jgi:hypothetical protein
MYSTARMPASAKKAGIFEGACGAWQRMAIFSLKQAARASDILQGNRAGARRMPRAFEQGGGD